MTNLLIHPSVRASVGALVLLAVVATISPLPVWVWLIWAAITAVAIVQAMRAER